MILSDISKRVLIVQGEKEMRRIMNLSPGEHQRKESKIIGDDVYEITITNTGVGTLRNIYKHK